jgi:hypothetical protein
LIAIDSLTDACPKGSIITDGKGALNRFEQSYRHSNTFDTIVAGIVGPLAKSTDANENQALLRAVALSVSKPSNGDPKNQRFKGSPFFSSCKACSNHPMILW